MMRLENHHFTSIVIIILKFFWNFNEKKNPVTINGWVQVQDIFIVSTYLPTYCLVGTKGKIVTLQWINPANKIFRESKLIPLIMGQTNIMSFLIWCPENIFCDVPIKIYNLFPIMRKYQTKFNWRILYKITGFYFSKKPRLWKTKKGWGLKDS